MPHYLISRKRIPAGAMLIQCQDTWLDGCNEIANWQISCGPEIGFYCDRHEGPPCGGEFLSDFVISAETTREELERVLRCGVHRIHSWSGLDVHELRCCACSQWIGNVEDPEISHVSIPLQAECRSQDASVVDVVRCLLCESEVEPFIGTDESQSKQGEKPAMERH